MGFNKSIYDKEYNDNTSRVSIRLTNKQKEHINKQSLSYSDYIRGLIDMDILSEYSWNK